ncbi:MAG: hypothetical protein AAF889_10445 [Cyanobacteria bacterium P01_D01_bin.73]
MDSKSGTALGAIANCAKILTTYPSNGGSVDTEACRIGVSITINCHLAGYFLIEDAT